MKTVLLATSKNGRGPVFELPFVLKQAGFHVTLMCGHKTRSLVSSYHDVWIESSEEAPAIVAQVATLVSQNPDAFDWVILGDDAVLEALADAKFDMALKLRFSPMRRPEYLGMLGSKIETARLLQAHGILMPASKGAGSTEEAAQAAIEIGFPVMVKIEHSGGGEGVFKCHSAEEVLACRPYIQNHRVLVEKFVEGELISIEALFMNGRLMAHAYSEVISYLGFGVSARRTYRPWPAIKKEVETLGKNFALHGFTSLGYIREKETGRHYMMEADLRENAWAAYTRFAGVDMAKALKAYIAGSPLPAQQEKETIVSMPHREIRSFIRQKQFLPLLGYVCNPVYWRFIPFHDPHLIFTQFSRLGDFMLERLQKLAPPEALIKQN
ncbi:MAG: ATP-grasp domain-containing protein [Proteobacteria bacterium]|nr:ATP-grasp domain-containing protein [Pseudomonadota bacterium]